MEVPDNEGPKKAEMKKVAPPQTISSQHPGSTRSSEWHAASCTSLRVSAMSWRRSSLFSASGTHLGSQLKADRFRGAFLFWSGPPKGEVRLVTVLGSTVDPTTGQSSITLGFVISTTSACEEPSPPSNTHAEKILTPRC